MTCCSTLRRKGKHPSALDDDFVRDSLAIGVTLQFPRWLFYVTQKAQAFNQEDYDGLIGQDVLSNFDLYLDYHHATIYLVPNERYRTRWGN